MKAKLENPRRFDRGKIKTWDEKLKMPNFHFSDQEITDLVTVIQGFSKARMDTDMRQGMTAQRAEIEEGRRIIRDHNCTGCHIIGKQGGGIRAKIKDPGYFPPSLDGEGEKVIPVWLFSFLKGPTTVRPWLNVADAHLRFERPRNRRDFEDVCPSRQGGVSVRNRILQAGARDPELLAGGSKLFTDFKCLQCHFTAGGKTERDAADLAPNLSLARSRLRPSWIEKWLRDPQLLQPGTRMPAYFPDMKSPDPLTLGGDAATQMKALKYHTLGLAPKGAPVTTGN